MSEIMLPSAIDGQRVIGEARRLRHEIAWTLELPDGRRAVLAQLAPELAAEVSLRRRWVADMERVAALTVACLTPTLLIGPAPDPRAIDAEPPWRVRLDPSGTSLDQQLQRAPLPLDEAIELGERLADALHAFHAAGAVMRDLDPRSILRSDDTGQLWFTDIGHARLAILSSRTASSLLLEGSPYVAPEALLRTVVDARADVYSLGVVLWRALTGRVPFEASLSSARTALPNLCELRNDTPPALAAIIARCLAFDPEQRPPTAHDVADALRGKTSNVELVVAREKCQACGALLRVGMRLCLSCGKQAVQFHRAAESDPDASILILDKAKETAAFDSTLRNFYQTVGTSIPKLNFVVGDRRMYSKVELAGRHSMPVHLLADIEHASALSLASHLRASDVKVRVVSKRMLKRQRRVATGMLVGSAALLAVSIVASTSSEALAGAGLSIALVGGLFGWLNHRRIKRWLNRSPLGQLRETPAALPAADTLVAIMAKALTDAKSPDVRARLEEITLLVQRLCDSKAALSNADLAEAERVTAPVTPVVELARQTAEAIDALDGQLASLDEGAIVRALARCDARNEAPELRADLLAGLDTMRSLEEQRAVSFGRLLEITSLARTVVELGLVRASELRSDDIEVALAIAALNA